MNYREAEAVTVVHMPVLYIWPDDAAHVNVERVTDFHVFEFVED